MPASEFFTLLQSLKLDLTFRVVGDEFVKHIKSGATLECNGNSKYMYITIHQNTVDIKRPTMQLWRRHENEWRLPLF